MKTATQPPQTWTMPEVDVYTPIVVSPTTDFRNPRPGRVIAVFPNRINAEIYTPDGIAYAFDIPHVSDPSLELLAPVINRDSERAVFDLAPIEKERREMIRRVAKLEEDVQNLTAMVTELQRVPERSRRT